jgi:tRNA dimethylallyltransferase
MNETNTKVIVILGPTAVGKSDLAVKCALHFNGEIISADSRQVYKGLDIGTGKITEKEMLGIKHYLLDVCNPQDKFSVIDFKRLGEKAIEEIENKGKLPIICGGTGFYIQNLIDNISLPDVSPNESLRKELSEKSIETLYEILLNLDPDFANKVDKNNKRKLIRAIEIVKEIGKVPEVKNNETKYKPIFIGLTLPNDLLKERIANRLEKRIEQGMIEEVIELHKNGLSYQRMDELGLEYRYISKFLQNELSFDDMKEKLKTEIWHYAKRQMTWFKKDKRIVWFSPEDVKDIENYIKNSLLNN